MQEFLLQMIWFKLHGPWMKFYLINEIFYRLTETSLNFGEYVNVFFALY